MSQLFHITITETLVKHFDAMADDKDEAISKALNGMADEGQHYHLEPVIVVQPKKGGQ